MKLTIHERLVLLSLLPKEGTILTIKRLRVLREELSFTDEEEKNFGFVTNADTGFLTWSPESSDMEFDITIGETLTDLIKAKLRSMDAEGKVADEHISLYDKFIGG